MDEAEDEPEEPHVLRVGCDLEPAEELETRKEAHDAAKRDREFWARQVLLEANRLPEQVQKRQIRSYFAECVCKVDRFVPALCDLLRAGLRGLSGLLCQGQRGGHARRDRLARQAHAAPSHRPALLVSQGKGLAL